MRGAGLAFLVLLLSLGNAVSVPVSASASSRTSDLLRYVLFVRHREGAAEKVEQVALERSDPLDTENFGKFLSVKDVLDLQKPCKHAASAVWRHVKTLQALEGSRLTAQRLTPAGDKVEVLVSRAFFEQLGGWSAVFPPTVERACDFIAGGDGGKEMGAPPARAALVRSFHRSNLRRSSAGDRLKSGAANPQACLANQVDPPCLRKAYGLNATTVGGRAPRNAQCVAVNEYYSPADVASFQKQFGAPAQPIAHDYAGKNDPSQPGTEASLDVEYIMTTGRLVNTSWVYLDQNDPNPFTSWLTWAAKCSDDELPLVHSLSVGVPENEFETLGAGAIARMNTEMAALGARGATLVFASGDAGYPGQYQNYPASSWAVLATGGVWNGDLGLTPLSVDPISTGGFSGVDANPIQKWQVHPVSHWARDTKGQRPAHFNSSRRCVPDVATFDTSYQVVVGGGLTPVGGTSCAAPTTSGMLSIVNEELLLRKLPPLGMVAPFIYANADLLLDITRGNNNGYAATPGYDPASGLGSWRVDSLGRLIEAAVKAKEALPHRW
jgi:Subtilase family